MADLAGGQGVSGVCVGVLGERQRLLEVYWSSVDKV